MKRGKSGARRRAGLAAAHGALRPAVPLPTPAERRWPCARRASPPRGAEPQRQPQGIAAIFIACFGAGRTGATVAASHSAQSIGASQLTQSILCMVNPVIVRL